MEPDIWDRAQALFLSAADLPAGEREAFLESGLRRQPRVAGGSGIAARRRPSQRRGDLRGGERRAALLFDSRALEGERLGAYG